MKTKDPEDRARQCEELGIPVTDAEGRVLSDEQRHRMLAETMEKYSIDEDFTWNAKDSLDWPFTPPLHVIARLLDEEPNMVWFIEPGHIVNALESALDQLYGDPHPALTMKHPPRGQHVPTLGELKALWVTRNRHNNGHHTNAAEKIEYKLGFDLFLARLRSRR